ncbi:MAG TPA: glycosyltransferase [Candidatus Paceibacterota bacterium]|nr:glycosyltransferase [Candidatus Paceibacterota bacterium]
MRIAYFSDNFYPEVSGITDSILTQGDEMKKRGHEVLYVAPYYAKRDYEATLVKDEKGNVIPEPEREYNVVHIPSLFFPGSPTGHGRIALPLLASLSKVKRFKPDIIHTQTPYGAGLEALFVSRILGVPLIGTNHSPIEAYIEYSPIPFPGLEHIAKRYDSWYYNRCHYVTAPYQGLIDLMRGRGFKKPGGGQPNPISLEQFTPTTPEEKQDYKKALGIEGPLIVYAGRLAPEKHVDDILRAVGRLVEIFPNILFVASGHGSAQKSLKLLAHQEKIREHVRFPGFVTSEELSILYKAADVFVIMSTAETQSLVLMQAYASGTPAVVARAGALPEFTPPECGFVVDVGSDAQLSQKIELILKDSPLREKMGRAAINYVQQFSPEKIAAQWEKIYASCFDKNLRLMDDAKK